MSKLLHALSTIALCATTLTAQPAIDLLQLYDRDGASDYFTDIYYTTDEDYFVCGGPWALCIDGEGDIIWEYSEDDNPIPSLTSIIQADNGDAVIAGRIGDNMCGAIRLDADGEIVWRREYISGGASAIIELKNDNFVIAGRNYRDRNYGYVIMINPDGEPIWEQTYGEDANQARLKAMRETDDGVVVVGDKSLLINGQSDRHGWALKIDHDEEGNILWSRNYEAESLQFCSIVSTGFGFAVGGKYGSITGRFSLYFLNRNGELRERILYSPGYFTALRCLNKLSDGGYILVGNTGIQEDNRRRYPLALRTSSAGVALWTNDFSEIVDQQPDNVDLWNVLYGVIVQPGDVIVACGTMYNENGHDGLIVRLEPDRLSPIIFYWSPEDTNFTVLRNDTTEFEVRARDQQGDEFTYMWTMGEDTLGHDSTVTKIWENVGEYVVQCQASDGENVSNINWHVEVTDMYINSHQPDSLNPSIRRNSTIDFSVTTRAVEDDPDIEYNWLHNDEQIADNDSVSIRFERGREHSVTAIASQGELSDSVTWQVMVNDLIVDYMPQQLELSVEADTTFEFEVFPFNPSDDSLQFLWTLNGDSISDNSWVLVNFDSEGLYSVTAFVSDTTEADSLTWEVNVTPVGIHSDEPQHPDTPTLYPPVPNPFNSQLKIKYSIPNYGRVKLELLDIRGRVLDVMRNKMQKKGNHHLTYSGNSLTSGVYFIRFSSDANIQVEKILMLK